MRRVTVAAALLVASACTTATTPRASAPTPLVESQDLASLDCGGLGETPSSGEVTFVVDRRLYASTPSGTDVACLADDIEPGALSWGPRADRVLVGSLESILATGAREIADGHVRSPVISYPTGRSVVYISSDRARLLKVPTSGAEPEEVSFLARTDEVVYHPAGRHVVAVGKDAGGSYGLWLATNVGRNPRRLAQAETARRLYSLSYGADGSLAFAADHGRRFDVHLLTPGIRIQTIHSGPQRVSNVIDSPWDSWIAFRIGSCDKGATHVYDGRDRAIGGRLAGMSAEPAGWLPGGRLLILARPYGCDGPADLHVWSTSGTKLLVQGVDRAAGRGVLPAPPPPPGPPGEAEA